MSVLDKWTAIIGRRDRQAKLFGEMMLRFGMFERHRSFSLTDGLALGSAARVCLQCHAIDRCEAWLNRTGPLAEAEKFCPNAPLFLELGRLDVKCEVA